MSDNSLQLTAGGFGRKGWSGIVIIALLLTGCAEYRGMAKMAADEHREAIFRISCGITLGSYVRLPGVKQVPVMAQAKAVCP